MSIDQTPAPAAPPRRGWTPPAVTRLAAGDARNRENPSAADNIFSFS